MDPLCTTFGFIQSSNPEIIQTAQAPNLVQGSNSKVLFWAFKTWDALHHHLRKAGRFLEQGFL